MQRSKFNIWPYLLILPAVLIIGAVVAWDAAHAGGPPAEVRLTNIDAPTTAVFVAEFDRRWPNAGGGQEE